MPRPLTQGQMGYEPVPLPVAFTFVPCTTMDSRGKGSKVFFVPFVGQKEIKQRANISLMDEGKALWLN